MNQKPSVAVCIHGKSLEQPCAVCEKLDRIEEARRVLAASVLWCQRNNAGIQFAQNGNVVLVVGRKTYTGPSLVHVVRDAREDRKVRKSRRKNGRELSNAE